MGWKGNGIFFFALEGFLRLIWVVLSERVQQMCVGFFRAAFCEIVPVCVHESCL